MIHSNGIYNKRIICVDDEEVMLDTYRSVLGGIESDVFAGILDDSPKGRETYNQKQPFDKLTTFEIILAKSGEEALAFIEKDLANDRPIAAGFFDMRMPGGIDGYETIRRARKLDSKMLCAVVTAYTDRSVEQIAELFTEGKQDELLYFNKPFRTAELRQTAVNMICSWNRKRNEEEQFRIIKKNRLGLQCILDSITNLMWIPPRSLQAMLSGILYQSLALIDSENGYIGVLTEEGNLMIGHALGKFKNRENSIISIDPIINKVLEKKNVYIEDHRRCVIPLVYSGRYLGLIDMESPVPIEEEVEKNILETFGSQMVPLILNSIFYDEIMKKEHRSLTDPLTGLFNRSAIHTILQNELSRSSRFSFSVAILITEIGNFSAIIKKHGRKSGDLIVKGIGDLLRKSVRKYDIVGRNAGGNSSNNSNTLPCHDGGFSIILAQTDEEEALKIADHLRQKLTHYTFTRKGATIDLKFKIGFGVELLNSDINKKECLAKLIKKAQRATWKI